MFGLNDRKKQDIRNQLNNLLPPDLKIKSNLRIEKDYWSTYHSEKPSYPKQFKNWIDTKSRNLAKKQEILKRPENIPNEIVLYSCQPNSEYKPIGLIDIGKIYKFSGSTTGDRFAGGLIGYAIESAIDQTYAKSNQQEGYVNECKSELIKKCCSVYKDAIAVFNFDVDFREMGSSGNVFLYMRGTACAYNDEKAKDMYQKNKIKKLEIEIDELKTELTKYEANYLKFPKTWDETKKLIP